MKRYEKPTISSANLVQSELIAAPWGSFASGLEEMGGGLTSYDFNSGIDESAFRV